MTDIELVIKLPEEMWEKIKEGYVPLGINKYLKNGTPLPKGHGDLIDKNEIIKRYEKDCGRKIYVDNFIHDVELNIPTIIEADKGGRYKMRLNDADKLYPDCLTKEGTLAISQSQIAEAPTVEINAKALNIAIGAIKRDSKVDDITLHWNDYKHNFVAACEAFEEILKVYGRGVKEC